MTEKVLADFLETVNLDTSLQEKLKAALPCSPLREAIITIAHEAGFVLSRAQAEMVAMQVRCGDVLL